MQFLAARPEISSVQVGEGVVEAIYRGEANQRHALLSALVQAGFQVESFSEQETSLETLFMKLTRGVVS
jgi:ABC-type multidrug transport system ATPase subunit